MSKQQVIHVDLQTIAKSTNNKNLIIKWEENIHGRAALRVKPTKKKFDEEDKWILMLNDIHFANAVVELDILGQGTPPQSNFLGIGFHATDDLIHDAVYFRPFNFRAEDPVRKIHAVQYVSHPEYPWFHLRRDKPEHYEKPIIPAPDGDAWFHAKIEIDHTRIRVYVEHSQQPSLEIETLVSRNETGFGLWCGPGLGGYFSNVSVSILEE